MIGPGAAAVVAMGAARERCRTTGTCGTPLNWADPWTWVWVGTMVALLLASGVVGAFWDHIRPARKE